MILLLDIPVYYFHFTLFTTKMSTPLPTDTYDEDFSLPTFPSTTSHVETDTIASESVSDSVSESASIPEFKNWEDVDEISPDLLRGIYAYGFEKPSNIQQKSILSIIQS